MTFENDVFLSYAHVDDESPVQGESGWISALHTWLAVRLAQKLGKEPRIWRDPRLRGNEVIWDSITGQLPSVAVFVSVLSPWYVKSPSCKRELDHFLRAVVTTGGVRVADDMRVFKVVKTPFDPELEPPELRPMRGYEFYKEEPQSLRTRELGPMSPPDLLALYRSKLDDLVHDIAGLLTRLENEAGSVQAGRTTIASTDPETRGSVYLAETSHDLQDRRDRIRRELQAHGYTVLPDKPLPLVGPDCLSFIRAQLKDCRLSIHMVGSNYGVVPEGSTESIVVMQHEQAVERAGAGDFGRLIWMPPDLTPSDARQQEFVAQLQTDLRIQPGADLLQTSLEDFKTVVQMRLKSPASQPAPRNGDSESKGVYVICDQGDREAVRPLERFLHSQGFNVASSEFDGDEASLRRDHEENLLLCDGVLIYYGQGGKLWFRQKCRDLKKSAGYGRTKPLLAQGVVLAPPLIPEKSEFLPHEAVAISWNNELTADRFETFFSRFR